MSAPNGRGSLAVASFGYHEVTDDPDRSGFQRPSARRYKLTPAAFDAHLKAIARGPVVPTRVTEADLDRGGRHLFLTFDDGGKSALDASTHLLRRTWPGHFFIVTDLIGTTAFLDVADIRALRAAGHIIGSHSRTHPARFHTLPYDRMVEEWRTSCDRLAQILGEPCYAAAVPGGEISQHVFRSAHEAGVRWLFTSDPTLRPNRVGACVVVGRFVPKVETSVARVQKLAQFRGWRVAWSQRRATTLLRGLMPVVYQAYLRRRDASPPPPQHERQP